jgi:hypothetical protein
MNMNNNNNNNIYNRKNLFNLHDNNLNTTFLNETLLSKFEEILKSPLNLGI